MILARHWWGKGLVLVVLPFVIVRATHAQAIEIQVTDTSGRALEEAVVQLLAHTSTTPLVVDTVRPQGGTTRVRVPTPRTNAKLYVVKICAVGYAPQFVTAPFAKFDTLRLVVRLAALEHDTARTQGPCDGTPDRVPRANVTDTSTFVGLAAASNLEVSLLFRTYDKLLIGGAQHDTIEARLYQQHTLTQLEQRLVRARSGSDRARAAHMLLSFAFSTHTSLDPKTRARLRAALPPGSKWWLSEPYLVGFWGTQLLFVSDPAGDPSELTKSAATRQSMQTFLERMANSIDEPEIRSEAQSQLVRLAYIGADTARAQSILDQMLVEGPNYPLTKLLASRYARNRPLREGAMMPAFDFAALPDTTNRITNARIAGKFTLIDFWGTWCGPCLGAMPELHRIYKAYHDRGFEILSVAADETPEIVNSFRTTKWPMPWLNAFAQYSEGGKDNPKLQELGVVRFPRAALVDPQGKIVAMFDAGIEELASTLDRVLTR